MAVTLSDHPAPRSRADRFLRARATRAAWLRDDILDRTRGRSATLNQLLLASVVFVLGALVVLTPFGGDPVLFFTGVVIIFVATGTTILIPWNRIPYGWVATLPAIDILAITLMVLSEPASAFGLLWIFPASWLASGFGLLGLFAAIVAIAGITGILFAVGAQAVGYAPVLLPLVLIALAATSYLTARRSDAQRVLLAKQAQLLTAVLERTRRQEQEVTEVLDAVDFGVIRISADGSVSVANEAHGRLQRAVRTEEVAEVPAFRDDALTPLPRDELPLERARRGEVFDGEIVWFGEPDAERQALSVTTRRLTDSAGGDAGAVVVSRDVTAELSALRGRDELVASVSHELRTPLTSILGFLDLAIEDPDLPDGVRSNLDIAERNAERLLRIVGDILSASSSSSASVEVSLTPRLLDAADTVRASVEALSPRAADRAVAIDTSGVTVAPVWADPLRLRQVVDNLLANAIAYNQEGGSVHLGTTTDGTATWILVRDTGRGMGEDERARLFERYYRAGTSRASGTGLGLAISRDIVRAHGGEIGVRSSPGTGSTFIVKLPAHGPAEPQGAAP
ncbi:MAG TPA: HAMP domain-containing sensor histidine kinase [Microbacterium sp.]|nr:HAMP domain-containing sensor histidine kinase [Microbacterium sp.]